LFLSNFISNLLNNLIIIQYFFFFILFFVAGEALFDLQAREDLRQKASTLLQRSQRAVRSLFDPASGLLTPHGPGASSFSAVEWGNGFTEGSAWHHSFPPYAIYTGDQHKLG